MRILSFIMIVALYQGACSSAHDQPVLTIRITDAESHPIVHMAAGETKAARVWVKSQNALPLNEVAMETVSESCVRLEEPTMVLTATEHQREDGELVRSVLIRVDDDCPSGTEAALLVRAHAANGERVATGELNKRFAITPSIPRPMIQVRELRINGLARRSVFPGESLQVGVSFANAGLVPATELTMQISINETGNAHPALSLTDAVADQVAPGEFRTKDWEPTFSVPVDAKVGSEWVVSIAWSSHGGEYSGRWNGPVRVVTPPYPERVLINGRSEMLFSAGDVIEVGFDLANQSDIDIGPGEVRAVSTEFGEIVQQMDAAKFSDLGPFGRSRLAANAFRLKSHVSSINGVRLAVRWQTIYGYSGNFVIDLSSKESR